MSIKHTELLYTPCPSKCTASPIINNPHQRGIFVTADEPTLTHHHRQSPKFTSESTLGDVYSVGLDKRMVTRIPIVVSHRVFPALNILCAWLSHPSFPQPLATTDPFSVSIALLFPERHIVGIPQRAVFLNRFPSLSHIHFRFLSVFSWSDSLFLFITE